MRWSQVSSSSNYCSLVCVFTYRDLFILYFYSFYFSCIPTVLSPLRKEGGNGCFSEKGGAFHKYIHTAYIGNIYAYK
jgi:hypothetical protein